MGQLEKYGLYVLCLVIFLILGVALWGDPAVAAEKTSKSAPQASAPAQAGGPSYDLNDFKELMSLVPHPEGHRSKGTPAAGNSGDGNSGNGNSGNRNSGNRATPGEGAPPRTEPPAEPADAGHESAAEPALSSVRPKHKIVKGDTLSTIAMDKLGSMRFAPLVQELNPGLRPEGLQLGQEIVLPSPAEMAVARAKSGSAKAVGNDAGKAAAGSSTRQYWIQRGDTLEGLAKRELGSARRLEDIKRLNPAVDPTRLRIGQVILLPAK